MTLNTYVAGNPGEARSFARELRKLGQGTESSATGVHQARKQAAGEWDGAASEAFQGWAKTQGTDGDALAEVYPTVARAHEAWADEIDTVQARMEQAKQVARDGGLTVMGNNLILPPKAPQMRQPEPPKGRATAAQSEQYSQDKAAYDAAMTEMHRQQAVWEEAKATVEGARQKERTAHKTFVNALDEAKTQLTDIGQAEKWGKAGVHPASSAAGELAQAATVMEANAAETSKNMIERAAGNPAAVNSAWAAMASEQRSDLIARHPQLVGNTDGIPCVARDQANRSILGGQRANLVSKIEEKSNLIKKIEATGGDGTWLREERQQLYDSLESLDKLSNSLDGDKYLLGIDSTANQRGQVIVAEGNPDHADNTMTMVPGTYSDLSNVHDYVGDNHRLLERANELSPGSKNATITWVDYEAPSSLLPGAAQGGYADNAHPDLSNFQEGLRTTHEGDAPSRNTLIGHSYGSTVVGEASHKGGSHADNIAFVGSPGVGVDDASQLDVSKDHVWAAKSNSDIIDYTPSVKPWQWTPGFGDDYARYGLDPTEPKFGAEDLPRQSDTSHSDYWKDPVARDGMARIMTGTTHHGVAQ